MEGLGLLLALGGLGAAHTGYSITPHWLALLAFCHFLIVSCLEGDYKRDGLIQDTGGPIISIEPASLWSSPACPLVLQNLPSPTRRSSLAPWLSRKCSPRVSGRQMVPRDMAPRANPGGRLSPRQPDTEDAGREARTDLRAARPHPGKGALRQLARSLEPELAHATTWRLG